MTSDSNLDPSQTQGKSPSMWQTALSVLAAFFGVQNRANRERDFRHGRPLPFIVMGLLLTSGLIGLLVLVVKFALSQAGV